MEERGLWLLCAILVATLLCYLNSMARRVSARQPPGPTPLPLIDNLLDLRGHNLHHTLARLACVHGPVMRLKLGLTTAVVVSTRDAAREAFPGLPMAERVLPYILASLLHAFEWRLPDGVSAEQLDVREKFTTANVMAVPLKAVPVAIN